MNYLAFFLFTLSSLSIYSQDIQINWTEVCDNYNAGRENINIKFSPSSENQLIDFCSTLDQLDNKKLNPIEIFSDQHEKENPWKVTFYFGHARVDYKKTNLNIKTNEGNHLVRDVKFEQRHGGKHFNPANWDNFESAFNWIDEPTNLIEFAVQKGNHIIYLSIFHPKHLIEDTSKYQYSTTTNNEPTVSRSLRDDPIGISSFQVTEWNLESKVSYGYQLQLLGKNKKTKVFYTPRVGVGLHSSKSRLFHDDRWKEQNHTFNGYSFSVGNRLEIKRARLGIFIDYGLTRGHFDHRYEDVNIDYNLTYTPITFGLSFKLFEFKAKKKK